MKAITIKQPWASLIVEGIKDIENRSWPCPKKYIGKRILIHASAKSVEYNSLREILTKAQWEALRGNFDPFKFVDCGTIIGSVKIIDCVINHPSIWAEQSSETVNGVTYGITVNQKPIYNWVLANPIKFPEPIPAKGKLSFWDYPNILAEPEEKGGMLYCHCQLPVNEKAQVVNYGRGDFRCCYCGARWYK